MKSRKTIYSRITTIEQLRAERNSLEWHIKGLENRIKDSIPARLTDGKFVPSEGSGFLSWLPVLIPVAITAFTLVRHLNRCVQKIRNR
ncbi:MAG TPA: hypothetical protein PKU85_01260 [Bacteroidales bacterium]|nr:MAG: hypothetical protein BWX62_01235 [Bacteroidetes bacterium ADurb.Bin037]HPV87828.1 hypothetical protein [Bacteroidales bacterium]HPW78862.1 hypothetical protein [Bacteroidales bacterium]HQB55560.1 hypothetical protein [Bacteroidales bacterium]